MFRINLADKEPPLTIQIRLDEVSEGLHFEVRIGTCPTTFYKLYQDKKKIVVTNFLSDFLFLSVSPEVKPDQILLMSLRVSFLKKPVQSEIEKIETMASLSKSSFDQQLLEAR